MRKVLVSNFACPAHSVHTQPSLFYKTFPLDDVGGGMCVCARWLIRIDGIRGLCHGAGVQNMHQCSTQQTMDLHLLFSEHKTNTKQTHRLVLRNLKIM